MMSHLHIYRASDQPATRYRIEIGEGHRDIIVKNHPKKQLYTMCCRRLRVAENCIVHVYYDGISYFCHHEKGCRGLVERLTKQRREQRNRRRAAKAAWARRKATR